MKQVNITQDWYSRGFADRTSLRVRLKIRGEFADTQSSSIKELLRFWVRWGINQKEFKGEMSQEN